MDDQPHIRVEFVSDPIYLSGARELVAAVAKRLGFDDLQCSKISLAVDEALCNVIRHGYDRATDRPIWLDIWPIVDRSDTSIASPPGEMPAGSIVGLRLRIEDEARQVDPDSMRGRDLGDIKPGGLGVHIIREVMDDVRYERREEEGKGMRLTMLKYLSEARLHRSEDGAARGSGSSSHSASSACTGGH